MNKKILSLLLVITMLLSLIPSSISTVTAESGIIATDVVAAADGNMTVTYAITSESDSKYTLTISGSGALANYSAKNTPWAEYNSKITKVIIEEGIKALSADAFSRLSALTEISVALSTIAIDETALPSHSFILKGYMNHVSGTFAESHNNIVFKAKTLRILAIGNSHTADWSAWVDPIFSDLDAELETNFELTKLTFGGRGLVKPTSRGSHYEVAKGIGDYQYTESDRNNYINAFKKTYDIVIMQDYHESTSTDDKDGGANYADDIQKAVDWIHTEAPGAKIIWFADWADKNYNKADLELSWNQSMKAIAAVKTLGENKPDYIVPASTVLQNARTSYLGTTNNKVDALELIEGGFTDFAAGALNKYTLLERDGTHMSLELGRYLMGSAVLYHIVNFFDDVIDANDGLSYFNTVKTAPEFTNNKGQAWLGEFVPEIWAIIRESVENAYTNPSVVTSCSSKYATDPFIAAYEQVKTIIKGVDFKSANPTEADIIAAYRAESVVSALEKIELFDITADDIVIEYIPETELTKGVCNISVDCHYGYSYPEEPLVTIEMVKYGDSNGDGNINTSDFTAIRRYLLKGTAVKNGADANGNGKTDICDLVLLNEYLESIGGGNIIVTPLDQKKSDFRPTDRSGWSICDLTQSGRRYTVNYNYPAPLTDTERYPSYEADGVTPTKWKTTHDNIFTPDRSAYVGGMAPSIIVKNNANEDVSNSVYTYLSNTQENIEGKSLMFYVKHNYDDDIKNADKQSMLLGLLITNHYLYSGNPYYIYDKSTGEWSKKVFPHLIDDLPIYYRSSASYIELTPDFEGWVMIPATSLRDNKNNVLSTFTDVKFAPGTLGGIYGNLTYGDLCIVENIDPTLNGDTGALTSNTIALPSDFPFAVKEPTTVHSFTPIVPKQVRNYPLSPAWNMQTMTKKGNRYTVNFKLPDPFACELYPKDTTIPKNGVNATYQQQYDKLFSDDGTCYDGGIYTHIYYYSYDDLSYALQDQNARLNLGLSEKVDLTGKAIMFYVDHSYDSNIKDSEKQAIEFTTMANSVRAKEDAPYYRYDIATKKWTVETAKAAGEYAPEWNGTRLTIPVDFEGWFLIPASSLHSTAITEVGDIRFYWHALGGKYGDLTIGDVCITDITDPTVLGDNDRATSANTTDLANDFPLTVVKPTVLGPQQ